MKLQGNVLKRNSMRLAAALVVALTSFVAGPNAALAAAPKHHEDPDMLDTGQKTNRPFTTYAIDAHPSLQRWHNAAAISFARRWMSDRNRGYSLAVGG